MPLYIAPKDYEPVIRNFLTLKNPESRILIGNIAFACAQKLVSRMCASTQEVQPSVKIIAQFEGIRLSVWLGIELHHYGDFVDMMKADHTKSKFLFHGRNRLEQWELLYLKALKTQVIPAT